MDAEDDDYVCTLDQDSLELAKRELFEVPSDHLGSVKAFRQWIQDQPHLKCKTDTTFLMWFLRGAKFSQLRARELLQNYLRMFNTMPDWFCNIDTHDPNVLGYINTGATMLLPKRDNLRRQILLIRPGKVHPNDKFFGPANEMRAAFAMTNLVRYNETTQVHGQVLIFDFTGYTMKHFRTVKMEDNKKSSKVWQDCTPGRVKQLHFYNAGTFFEAVMGIMRPFMKSKFLERFRVHSTLESLYRFVPKECLPDEYLPDDYDGLSAGPVQKIIDDLKAKLANPEFREKIARATNEDFGIDKSKVPGDITPSASFRKLNLD